MFSMPINEISLLAELSTKIKTKQLTKIMQFAAGYDKKYNL